MKGTLCQLSYRGIVLTPGVEPDPTAYQTVMHTAYTRSGRIRQESDLQGREARRVSKPVPSPVGLRIQERSGRDSDPQGGFRRSPVFGTGAVSRSARSEERRDGTECASR